MKNTRTLAGLVFLLSLGLTACSRAPSIDIIGSYFPVWMLCLSCALILTFLARTLLARWRLELHVGPVALFYPCLTLSLTCMLWLLCFR